MIHFEIIESTDDTVKNQYQFFQNEIYLGRTSGNLIIADNQLKISHLMIEVVEKDLLVHPQRGVDFYLINGKRSSSIRKIKVGQTLTIGMTTLKIIAFELSELRSKKEVLDTKLQNLVNIDSPRLKVIEALSKQMK